MIARITLSDAELARLRRPIKGKGGFQTFLRNLQPKIRGHVLTLDGMAEIERFVRYWRGYGKGGFQQRLAPARRVGS
jgi:hypothetical protein